MKKYAVREGQFALILSLPDLRALNEYYTADYSYRGKRWLRILKKIEAVLQAAVQEKGAETRACSNSAAEYNRARKAE